MTELHGRGAWSATGVGGTRQYKDATKPGPYYYLGVGKSPGRARTADEYAVYRAVVAYQRALNRRLNTNLLVDGWFGTQTSSAVATFQTEHPEVGTPWGGIGPQTSEALLRPDLIEVVETANGNPLITVDIVSGTVRHESQWDAGAVGYTDPNDLGLAQINGVAHPDLSVEARLYPRVAFNFVVEYYNAALGRFNNNVRDSISSYNLGAGGTRDWISKGRPEWYTPSGSTTPRNVWAYIDDILEG